MRTIAPLRVTGSALAAAANSTVPSPCPDAPDRIDSQAPSAVAVHEHSRAADTVTVPLPPCAPIAPAPVGVTLQRVNEEGDVEVVADEPQAISVAQARRRAGAGQRVGMA